MRAQGVLSNPVKEQVAIVWRGEEPLGHHAGLTALSDQTMLAPPGCPVRAIGSAQWIRVKQQDPDFTELDALEPDAIELQIWRYSPDPMAHNSVVDPLSLYLSLRDSEDERIITALETLRETLQW